MKKCPCGQGHGMWDAHGWASAQKQLPNVWTKERATSPPLNQR